MVTYNIKIMHKRTKVAQTPAGVKDRTYQSNLTKKNSKTITDRHQLPEDEILSEEIDQDPDGAVYAKRGKKQAGSIYVKKGTAHMNAV